MAKFFDRIYLSKAKMVVYYKLLAMYVPLDFTKTSSERKIFIFI